METMAICEYCGKCFSRTFNLKRHKKVCYLSDIDDRKFNSNQIGGALKKSKNNELYGYEAGLSENNSDTEDEDSESESETCETESEDEGDEESANETSETESEEEDDEESDNEPRTVKSPWNYLVKKVYKFHSHEHQDMKNRYMQKGFNEEVANSLAHNNLIKDYRKTLREMYSEHILLLQKIKKDPIYEKVMKTKRQLIDEEGYGGSEALQYAIKKRKFLINEIIPEIETEVNESDYDIDETEQN
jgi:hypothetical protein